MNVLRGGRMPIELRPGLSIFLAHTGHVSVCDGVDYLGDLFNQPTDLRVEDGSFRRFVEEKATEVGLVAKLAVYEWEHCFTLEEKREDEHMARRFATSAQRVLQIGEKYMWEFFFSHNVWVWVREGHEVRQVSSHRGKAKCIECFETPGFAHAKNFMTAWGITSIAIALLVAVGVGLALLF